MKFFDWITGRAAKERREKDLADLIKARQKQIEAEAARRLASPPDMR